MKMKVLGFGLIYVMCVGLLFAWVANSYETKTLDEVVDRPPPVVHTFVDKEHGVVCYWLDHHRNVTCVRINKEK